MTPRLDSVEHEANTPGGHARASRIAERLRQASRLRTPSEGDRLPWFALEHAVADDLAHIHAAHDLRMVPIHSARPLTGPGIVWLKRALLKLLHPLLETQSVWNGADARVVTSLLQQLSEQARAIEGLEHEVAQLRLERE